MPSLLVPPRPVELLRSDKPHDLPLKTIPMSDVFLLYLFQIFEEEDGVKCVLPLSL